MSLNLPKVLALSSLALTTPACQDDKVGELPLDSSIYDTFQSFDTGEADADTDSDADTDTDTDVDIADDGWPSPFVAPYVDATAYPTIKIGEIPDETNVLRYTLGFVVAGYFSDCEATWGAYYSIEEGPSAWEDGVKYTLYDQLAVLREKKGGDVMVSFGGASNTPLASACSNVADLFEEYRRVVESLHLTRVDFDIEGFWLADLSANDRRSEAIVQLQKEWSDEGKPLHVWYTLPVLPTGLTAEGLTILEGAVAAGVDVAGVNIMTMNYGDAVAPDPDGQMGEYGIQAMTSLHDQLSAIYGSDKSDEEIWAMVGSTPMIGLNDLTTEVFDLEDAEQTVSFAREKGVSMLSFWSINRDHPCDSHDVELDCHSLPDPPDWAFSHVFAEFE